MARFRSPRSSRGPAASETVAAVAGRPARPVVRARRLARRIPWQLAFVAPALVFLAAVALYPIARLIQMSLSDVTPQTITGDWPFVGLDQFRQVFEDPQFTGSFENTVVYTAIVVVLALAGGLTVALALRERGVLSRAAMIVMLGIWITPPLTSGLMWKLLLDEDGVVNSALLDLGLVDQPILFLTTGWLPLISVALVNAWVAIPFAAIVFRSALLDVPRDLMEQASVDGATPAQRFLHVTLPLLRPTTLVLASLIVVYAFKSFDFIYVMTLGGPGTASSTLPFLGWKMAFVGYEYSQAAAVAVVAMIVVSVFAAFYTRSVRDEVHA